MIDGIEIDENTFKRLPVKQQNLVLFRNTEQLKSMIQGYRFQNKIMYGWLSGLSALGTWVAMSFFNHINK